MLENVRIKDKKALVEYDLNISIFENYNFKVKEVIPVRKVFILITDKGNKILKKVNCGVEDLDFIYSAINYLKNNSFYRIFNFVLTKNNMVYFTWNNDIYCVMDLIEARESEYSNPFDVAVVSKGLGEFHRASEGFRHKNKIKFICGKIIENFKRRLDEMDLFKSIALMCEERNEFDNIFLESLPYYKEQIAKSIKILEQSNFYKLCSQEEKIVLCHHDLAHHNILIKEEEAYFIDLDYSIIDLKVHDLCNIINKVCKKTAYDIKSAELIINNYCSSNFLDKKELEVLYGMLAFPQDIYNIVKDYYTRTKDWGYGVFLDKLMKKNNFKEDREEFLAEFKDKILI